MKRSVLTLVVVSILAIVTNSCNTADSLEEVVENNPSETTLSGDDSDDEKAKPGS